MPLIQSLKVSLQDCVCSIHATPVPPSLPAGATYTSPPQVQPQLIGTVNVTGTECKEGDSYGCNITVRKSVSAQALDVNGNTHRVEIAVVEDIDNPCVELKCKIKIYDAGVTNNVSVQGSAGATIAGVTVNGNVNIKIEPIITSDFSIEVCCKKPDDECFRECRLVNPPNGVLI